ncbi:MAG: hypothetical protein DRH15_04455 [Deltaproteobacteria bacterium]|nr:hypothetical protein [Deltaproteobacteria bacterium]RLB84642.1 MAG: hypothetical protein DRH15_04455 [Deltaproteobacteria bacterium]HDM09335.1 hypothetical protein [Desulfobacteraceae bacterium]
MEQWSFSHHEMVTLSEALQIAEEVTSDYYKFSSRQWRRHPYDVKPRATWHHLSAPNHVFAVLNKGLTTDEFMWPRSKGRDFYFILLHDEKILSAIARDEKLNLLPLMLYVFTHELIHIVRFSNFIQRFEVNKEAREEEEKRVHGLTYEVLRRVPIKDLRYVLEAYETHRVCKLGLLGSERK